MNVTSTGIAVAVAVVIAIGLLFFGPAIFGLFSNPQAQTQAITTTQPMPETASSTASGATPIPQPLPTELTVTDEVVGTGAVAKAGDQVTVNYVGMLPDGTVFDASSAHPETKSGFTFPLGAGKVIAGWDKGVAGMKEGGKRQLIIPANLAYGAQGVPGTIPPNATLIFEVELLKVTPGQ